MTRIGKTRFLVFNDFVPRPHVLHNYYGCESQKGWLMKPHKIKEKKIKKIIKKFIYQAFFFGILMIAKIISPFSSLSKNAHTFLSAYSPAVDESHQITLNIHTDI